MCPRTTIRALLLTALLSAGLDVLAQTAGSEWRHLGNSAVEMGLPSVATGQVERVWYSSDGSVLYASTASGRTYQTADFEQWQRVVDSKIAPPAVRVSASGPPSVTALKAAARAAQPGRVFAVGADVYRSDNDGATWTNLTAFHGNSILGGGLTDAAASPVDPDEVVVASAHGIWRSLDAGLSWTGVNDFLPNLPASRLLALPAGVQGVRLALASGQTIEWAPGEKQSWKLLNGAAPDAIIRAAVSKALNRDVTAVAMSGNYLYAGDSEGWLQVSTDGGANWDTTFKLGDLGSVDSIWVDPSDPRVAIAALTARKGAPTDASPVYALRTMNGGIFWDDITANLPRAASARGVTADRASGAIYLATDAGVFYTASDLSAAGRATNWAPIGQSLPPAPVNDVRLDAGANQLYAVVDGYGVYVTLAPHRLRDARLVNAADYSDRPAAPGSLLSVLGARIESAQADTTTVPVLQALDSASEIQVPFEAQGTRLSLSLVSTSGRFNVAIALADVSPAIFVDPQGTPLIMDSNGVLLDASKPAHAGSHIQVLATGLGRVKPDWPTGMAAPIDEPPRVAAPVHAFLGGVPVEVTGATLAPGYVGFYLVEIQLPRIANTGPAELTIEAGGQQSNHVRLYTEP